MTSTMEEPTKNIQENLEANYTSHPSELVKDGVCSHRLNLDLKAHPKTGCQLQVHQPGLA